MTHSPLANGIQLTSDNDSRNGQKVRYFIVHHAATTRIAAILSLFQPGGREVSANYALGSDGTLILAVDEDRSAWTSASWYDDAAITIEVANSVAGGSWPVSDAAFDKLARLIADVSLRYGFPITDDTVLTHQELYTRFGESYATACPGDLQRRKAELLALANSYRAGTAGTGSTPIGGPLMALSDNEQAELLQKTRAVYDALFKLAPIQGSTTGGNAMPGGLLRMASINYDATIQEEGQNGAKRDGTLVALRKIEQHLGIVSE